MRFLPIIKWIGSKRLQSENIVKFFPNQMDTYYEPFCGGCSVMFQLMSSPEFEINKYICSDINGDLIDLWNTFLDDPDGLFGEYSVLWNEIRSFGDDRQMKRKFFEEVRDEFNMTRSPYLFFFLMRTTTNGIPRYNSSLQFNNTYHLTRDGMTPHKIKKIFDEWHEVLSVRNVEFIQCDYKDILDMVTHNDFIYLDPPYAMTRDTGKWFGNVDYHDMFDQLRLLSERGVKWALSYDFDNGDRIVPMDCYVNMANIDGKLGGYRKTCQMMLDDGIYENLYMNYA